ncbi:MAG TPA: fibronectin type III domain-containing protein, partial [Candidatus Binatia bacterium]|nr:fibronectin type III domain-containing protein [Candidatus Binatia bacterium]
ITPAQLGSLNSNFIGKSQWSGDPYLNGKVDDFRIYNGALSAAQVAALAAGYPVQPSAPTNVVASVVSPNQVDLTWSPALRATNYYVKRSTVNGGPYTTVSVPLTQTNYSDTGLILGTTYYYVVTAINDGGATNSAQVSARTVSLVSTNLTVGLSGNQLQFNWPADHTGWRLEMNTNLASPYWTDVSSNSVMMTNQISLPVTTTNGSVFYRLVYP